MPARKAQVGKAHRFARGGDALSLDIQQLGTRFVGGQRIGHFAEGAEDGLAVADQALLQPGQGRFAIEIELAAGKQWLQQVGANAGDGRKRPAIHEVVQAAADAAEDLPSATGWGRTAPWLRRPGHWRRPAWLRLAGCPGAVRSASRAGRVERNWAGTSVGGVSKGMAAGMPAEQQRQGVLGFGDLPAQCRDAGFGGAQRTLLLDVPRRRRKCRPADRRWIRRKASRWLSAELTVTA